MAKIIKFLCLTIILSFLATSMGCRDPVDSLNKEQVTTQIKESLQGKLKKDDTYKGIVSEVALIKEPPDKFTGLVEYSCNGHTETADIFVTIDKDLDLPPEVAPLIELV